MAPLVKDLAQLRDQVIRAMAVNLSSFQEIAMDKRAQEAHAAKLESQTKVILASSPGARLYPGACTVCHELRGLPLFGSRPSLALNGYLHGDIGQSRAADPARYRRAGFQHRVQGLEEPVSFFARSSRRRSRPGGAAGRPLPVSGRLRTECALARLAWPDQGRHL
jgi:hypothetical protein